MRKNASVSQEAATHFPLVSLDGMGEKLNFVHHNAKSGFAPNSL